MINTIKTNYYIPNKKNSLQKLLTKTYSLTSSIICRILFEQFNINHLTFFNVHKIINPTFWKILTLYNISKHSLGIVITFYICYNFLE